MTRAAIYARFSSSRQREESIEDQVRVCSKYISDHGWELARTYADEARSGTDASRRPGFLRAVEDAQRGRYDVLVVYKSDRFARNRFDAAVYKARLRRSGVQVESATEGVPDGPEGIILESVLDGMAEYYSANLAQNVMRGMEGNALKCRHNGVRLFGYECAADGTYRINEREAEGVEKAFRMAAEGARKSDIAAMLNAAGLSTPRGGAWKVDSVSTMLGNEKYTGTYIWGKVRVEGGMPAIIDRATYEEAGRNVSGYRKPRATKNTSYLLTGKLYDEDGNRFECNSGRSGGNGRYYYYYRCLATGVKVRKDDVEDRVRDAVRELLDREPGIDDEIVELVMAEQDRALSSTIERSRALHDRRAEVSREIDNLIDFVAKNGANPRVTARIDALSQEDEAIADELVELDVNTPVVEPDMVRFMLHEMRVCGEPDALVAGFVSRVVIDGDGGCLVCFNLLKKETRTSDAPEVREIGSGRPQPTFPELLPYRLGFAIAA